MDFDITKDRVLLIIGSDLEKVREINEGKIDFPNINGLNKIYKRVIFIGAVANFGKMCSHAHRIKIAQDIGASFKKGNTISLFRKKDKLIWDPLDDKKKFTGKEISLYEDFFKRYEHLLETNYREYSKMTDDRLKEIILHDEALFQKGVIIERDKYGYIIERDKKGNTVKKDDEGNIIEIIPPDK